MIRSLLASIVLAAAAAVGVVRLEGALSSSFERVELEADATRDFTAERLFTDVPPAALDWIQKSLIPLKSATAGTGFDDMKPILALVGDARIVSLGEATHGTAEFFQLKHRMLELLVEKKGFTVFGIEASLPDALAVNEYVLEGKGDPARALAGLGFWTWNTEEVLAMIRWMRRYNEDPAHEHKLKFYGFDMQAPGSAAKRLRETIGVRDPATLPALDALAPLLRRGDAAIAAAELMAVDEAIESLARWIDAHPRDADAVIARRLVETIRQAASGRGAPRERYLNRDRAMAENVKWILETEGPAAKIVLWSHNGHASTEAMSFAPEGKMGVHLRRAYGAQMVVVGFAFNRGRFQAISQKMGGLRQHTVEAAPLGSFDNALSRAGAPIFALDLRSAEGEARAWLDSPLRHRSVGAVYEPDHADSYLAVMHPRRSFDAVLFVDDTTAAKPTGVPIGPPPPPPAKEARNLGVESGSLGETPDGWMVPEGSTHRGWKAHTVEETCAEGAHCARLARGGAVPPVTGTLMQRIDATPYRGKKIRLRARVRSELPGPESSARLWLGIAVPGGRGFSDNMDDRKPGPLSEWTELEIQSPADVHAEAEVISFGLLVSGPGIAWIDDVRLEIVPQTQQSP